MEREEGGEGEEEEQEAWRECSADGGGAEADEGECHRSWADDRNRATCPVWVDGPRPRAVAKAQRVAKDRPSDICGRERRRQEVTCGLVF